MDSAALCAQEGDHMNVFGQATWELKDTIPLHNISSTYEANYLEV